MPQLEEHAANKAGAVSLIRFVDSDVEMPDEAQAEAPGTATAGGSAAATQTLAGPPA